MIRIILFRTVSFFSSHYSFAIFKIHSVVKIFTKHVHITSLVTQSCLTLCKPMDCSLLRPWDFPGKSIGVGYHFLLQGIFPT